jgi:hypothetical protein
LPNNFAFDINKMPFYLAGQKIDGLMFVVGPAHLKLSLTGVAVEQGTALVNMTPAQAREIGYWFIARADQDQRQLVKKAS